MCNCVSRVSLEIQTSLKVETMRTVIIDYGMGNISSIRNMLRYLGYSAILSYEQEEILSADRLIFPGVGNFGMAMENIENRNLRGILNEAVLDKKIPILGICLGMQLMMSWSEEGNCDGLGWISGRVNKFNLDTSDYKIPHMGWDYIGVVQKCKLLRALPKDPRFYFVHSYYVVCENTDESIAVTDYGGNFTSIIGRDNIFGVQFHPEKSHKFGMKIFDNFMRMYDVP